MLGEEADLPGGRRTELESDAIDVELPALRDRRRGLPPACGRSGPALVPGVGGVPRGTVATRRGCGAGSRPVEDHLAEPFEAAASAGIQELIPVSGVIHRAILPGRVATSQGRLRIASAAVSK